MPTAKTTSRIHNTPPPPSRAMRLDLGVNTPYGYFPFGEIHAYVHQYDEGPEHDWTGTYILQDEPIGKVKGSITMELPLPDRGGAPKKRGRDVAVYLAWKYFEALDCPKPRERVFQLWQKRRAEILSARAAQFQAAASCVERDLPQVKVGHNDTHSGMSDVGKVSTSLKKATKFLESREVGVIGVPAPYKESTGWAIGCIGEETLYLARGTYMVLLEEGARIFPAKSPNCCVVLGPIWTWAMGDEVATRHPEECRLDIACSENVPAAWLALGQPTA